MWTSAKPGWTLSAAKALRPSATGHGGRLWPRQQARPYIFFHILIKIQFSIKKSKTLNK
jgi:hypothetical protein